MCTFWRNTVYLISALFLMQNKWRNYFEIEIPSRVLPHHTETLIDIIRGIKLKTLYDVEINYKNKTRPKEHLFLVTSRIWKLFMPLVILSNYVSLQIKNDMWSWNLYLKFSNLSYLLFIVPKCHMVRNCKT